MKKIKLIFLTILISFSFSFQTNSKPVPASFADLAEKLMPSVVNISTSTTVVTNSNPLPFQFPPGSPLEDMFKELNMLAIVPTTTLRKACKELLQNKGFERYNTVFATSKCPENQVEIFRKNDLFFLCLVSGDKRCSLNKLKKSSNIKDLSMADADKVKEITGFSIGGVSPVGSRINLETLIDQNLNRFKDLYAAAGHPNAIFKINFFDLKKITSGKIMDLTE